MTAYGTAEEGQYSNLGTASATYDGTLLSNEDPSHYFGKELIFGKEPKTPADVTVGIEVFPVNKVTLLIPWIALALAIAATGVLLMRRKAFALKK